jgi:hypothetical protein
LSEFQSRTQSFLRAARIARDSSAAAAEDYAAVQRELDELIAYIEALEANCEAEIAREREARITADRHRERFRYALYVFLQERDGILGIHSPSLDTLKLIRELVAELDSNKEN